jgi:predicted RNase H-like HicB family nuclease
MEMTLKRSDTGRKKRTQDVRKGKITDLHYTMIIQWDDDDKIFVVTVPELPGCRTHGRTYEEAVRQGKDAIEGWIYSAQQDGEPIPPPKTLVA